MARLSLGPRLRSHLGRFEKPVIDPYRLIYIKLIETVFVRTSITEEFSASPWSNNIVFRIKLNTWVSGNLSGLMVYFYCVSLLSCYNFTAAVKVPRRPSSSETPAIRKMSSVVSSSSTSSTSSKVIRPSNSISSSTTGMAGILY